MKKIITKFNYQALQVGDMVEFCSNDFIAMVIRCFSAGFKNWNNYSIPTHTAMVVQVEGQFLVAEMEPEGLVVRSLEQYNKKNEPCWPKSVKRNPVYFDKAKRDALNTRVFDDLRHTLDYDFKGLLKFVIDEVKDDKTKAYCSQYFYRQTIIDGVVYPPSFADKVSPEDLDRQTSWLVVPNWGTQSA